MNSPVLGPRLGNCARKHVFGRQALEKRPQAVPVARAFNFRVSGSSIHFRSPTNAVGPALLREELLQDTKLLVSWIKRARTHTHTHTHTHTLTHWRTHTHTHTQHTHTHTHTRTAHAQHTQVHTLTLTNTHTATHTDAPTYIHIQYTMLTSCVFASLPKARHFLNLQALHWWSHRNRLCM